MSISFKPQLIVEVFNGNKTATRRSASSRLAPGQEHAILPGMARTSMGRLVITKVSTERLGDITEADVLLEGFQSFEEFKSYWIFLHKDYDPEKLVKRVEFVVVQQTHRLCAQCNGAGVNELEHPRGFDGEVR